MPMCRPMNLPESPVRTAASISASPAFLTCWLFFKNIAIVGGWLAQVCNGLNVRSLNACPSLFRFNLLKTRYLHHGIFACHRQYMDP